ncbi:MAG: hypothetical protein KDA61_15615 [Planctomycetales bacterium]|nr:hypothetical protein [Planctomycetales bacterium]
MAHFRAFHSVPTARSVRRPGTLFVLYLVLLGVTGCDLSQTGSDSTAPHAATTSDYNSPGQGEADASDSLELLEPAELVELVERTLAFTQEGRSLNFQQHAAWQLMHGALAYGRDFRARVQSIPAANGTSGESPQEESVIEWALSGKPMTGWILTPTEQGVRAELDPGKRGQGHEDQWLAILSQWDVRVGDPVVVDGRQFKIYDVLRRAMYDCYEGKESSWMLIALANYLDPLDQTWTARDGESWSVARIVGMEAGPLYDERQASQHINEAACGGTHRLIGLATALNRYRQVHPDVKLEGPWLAAAQRVQWAVETAQANQLPTGAFSILYFSRPANSASIDEHLASTGHTLEFLSVALPPARLREPWVRRAAIYLCDLLERTRGLDLECGALYHAAHGLVLYRDRLSRD